MAETLPTTSWIKLINKKAFAKEVLDKNLETFIMYISALEEMTIHLFGATQIVILQ